MKHEMSMDRFDVLANLKPNWDSYGAVVPDPRAVAKAKELFWKLPGLWTVVPCADGSVQLEQHCDGFDIEMQISAVADTGEKHGGR
jgi:hypothetical protein